MWVRDENVSVPFETQYSFSNAHPRHNLADAGLVAARALPRLLSTCHMRTYANQKARSHMSLRAHTRNEARSPEKSFVRLVPQPMRCVSRLRGHIAGSGACATLKSVLFSTSGRCDNKLCCLTPGLLALLRTLFPCFLAFQATICFNFIFLFCLCKPGVIHVCTGDLGI